MKRYLTRGLSILMAILIMLSSIQLPLFAESTALLTENPTTDTQSILPDDAPSLAAKSAVLIEESTGKILYAANAHEALPPASVTKIMLLLLVMEAIENGQVKLDDTVTTSANAASMGGSQVYLKEGEQMRLEDMLKSVIIASANDAAVALAEHLCGSVSSFVAKMNQKAEQLGMKNTCFENVTGLDDTAEGHLTSAYDIALMSRALIAHKKILEYSSIWMDTIRNGEFGLTNTNRLVRFYQGCTGLKTGSTSKAGFCVSATAKRGNLSLICVIMGSESRDARNAQATALLDWGFATFDLLQSPSEAVGEIDVIRGRTSKCALVADPFSCVIRKSVSKAIEKKVEMPNALEAPIKAGDAVGKIIYRCGGEVIGECVIRASESVEILNYFDIIKRMLARFLLI